MTENIRLVLVWSLPWLGRCTCCQELFNTLPVKSLKSSSSGICRFLFDSTNIEWPVAHVVRVLWCIIWPDGVHIFFTFFCNFLYPCSVHIWFALAHFYNIHAVPTHAELAITLWSCRWIDNIKGLLLWLDMRLHILYHGMKFYFRSVISINF